MLIASNSHGFGGHALKKKEICHRGLFQVQQFQILLNYDTRISSCSFVEARKQENNCFTLQYNSVVTSELFFEWKKNDD